jgi:hypothetical protein
MGSEKELAKANKFIHKLLDHLDYCNWGDAWEREGAVKLRKEADAWQEKHSVS